MSLQYLPQAVQRTEAFCKGVSGQLGHLKDAHILDVFQQSVRYGLPFQYYALFSSALDTDAKMMVRTLDLGVRPEVVKAYLSAVNAITSAGASLQSNLTMTQTLADIPQVRRLYDHIVREVGAFVPPTFDKAHKVLSVKGKVIPSEVVGDLSSVRSEVLRKALVVYDRTIAQNEVYGSPDELLSVLMDADVFPNIGGRGVKKASKTGEYFLGIYTGGFNPDFPPDRWHLRHFGALPNPDILKLQFINEIRNRPDLMKLFMGKDYRSLPLDDLLSEAAQGLVERVYGYAGSLDLQRGWMALGRGWLMRAGIGEPFGVHYASLWLSQRALNHTPPMGQYAQLVDEVFEMIPDQVAFYDVFLEPVYLKADDTALQRVRRLVDASLQGGGLKYLEATVSGGDKFHQTLIERELPKAKERILRRRQK